MKNLILSLALMMGFLINACSQSVDSTMKAAVVQQSFKLKIGDTYAGGIVFYLDTTGGGCQGLVCAPHDQSDGIRWDEAVALCKSLRIGGYSDWRLPSKDELMQMHTNLHKAGLGGFASAVYWSSVEADA